MTDATFTVNSLYSNATPADHVASGESSSIQKLVVENITDFFELDTVISWINQHSFKRIALQFPDYFIRYSHAVALLVEQKVGVKTFILADTTYRSCCVDEVAAAHASCDCLVHFGDACLSKVPDTLPVKFVLGRLSFNQDECTRRTKEWVAQQKGQNILILSDSVYGHVIDSLCSSFSCIYPDIAIEPAHVVMNKNKLNDAKTVCLGRAFSKKFENSEEEFSVLFIGLSDSPLLPLWLMTYPHCSSVCSFDPTNNGIHISGCSSVRQLRKRLLMVEKMRDAHTVGLVVGSVGVEGHRDAVQRMRSLCKKAGKKIYVISVGKINVPKLANFTTDIDIFVLVSCPFGVLLDCSDYFRPIISLFEAECALNPSKTWLANFGWTADFNEFVRDEVNSENSGTCQEADLSLVTGKIRITGDVMSEEDGKDGTRQVTLYTAGDYFKERTFKGLDDSVNAESESTEIGEGRAGIAVGYNTEK